MMSGEKVASIPVEEVEDVMTLKQELSRRHGLPPRFRQQLVLQGYSLSSWHTFHNFFIEISSIELACVQFLTRWPKDPPNWT